MTKYFDRELNPITQSQWMEHMSDDSYRIVRQFDNGKVLVKLFWQGNVTPKEMANLMPEYYPIFKIQVLNYNSVGVPINDPVDDGKTFGDESSANEFINNFLIKYTTSHWDGAEEGQGNFIESDNRLAPAPPPNLDAPSDKAIEGLTDEIGAW